MGATYQEWLNAKPITIGCNHHYLASLGIIGDISSWLLRTDSEGGLLVHLERDYRFAGYLHVDPDGVVTPTPGSDPLTSTHIFNTPKPGEVTRGIVVSGFDRAVIAAYQHGMVVGLAYDDYCLAGAAHEACKRYSVDVGWIDPLSGQRLTPEDDKITAVEMKDWAPVRRAPQRIKHETYHK